MTLLAIETNVTLVTNKAATDAIELHMLYSKNATTSKCNYRLLRIETAK